MVAIMGLVFSIGSTATFQLQNREVSIFDVIFASKALGSSIKELQVPANFPTCDHEQIAYEMSDKRREGEHSKIYRGSKNTLDNTSERGGSVDHNRKFSYDPFNSSLEGFHLRETFSLIKFSMESENRS